MQLEQRDAESAISKRFAQQVRNVAGAGQRGPSMGWMRVHHHMTNHNRESCVVEEREKLSDAATLALDAGRHQSLPIQLFCS